MSLCTECNAETRVVDSRVDRRGWRMRRRVCECGHRFTTFEIPNSQLEVQDLPNEDESQE